MELFREHGRPSTVELKRTTVTGVRKRTIHSLWGDKAAGGFHGTQRHPGSGHQAQELNIKGEKEFTGHGVAYCATCDAEFFKGKGKSMCWEPVTRPLRNQLSDRLHPKVTIVVLHEEGHLDCNEVATEHAYKNPKIDFCVEFHGTGNQGKR